MKKLKGKYLLIRVRAMINKNIKQVLIEEKDIIPRLDGKILPKGTYIRNLYSQSYFNFYAGLMESSLATTSICFERISRDIYLKEIGNDEKVSWNQIIEQLIFHFKNDEIKIEFLKLVKWYKDNVRNLVLHGKVEKFIKTGVKFVHVGYNIFTMEKKLFELDYIEGVHSKKKGEILDEKNQKLAGYGLLLMCDLINIFNQYINFEKL